MSQYNWATCPEAVEAQVTSFREHVQAVLGTNFVGLYLHGSLAMGCFNPERSDIDLIVVTVEGMSVEIKRSIAQLLLHASMAPNAIEISFLVEAQLHPFHHPLPFDFHYSETYRERYTDALAQGTWKTWNDEQHTDSDLAAHLTILLNRGICLFGKPIREVFPPVPKQAYIASLKDDFQEASDSVATKPTYFILNACRTYAYFHDESIFSKDEGGVWSLRTLPEAYHPLIEQALAIYRGQREERPYAIHTLDEFARFMARDIAASA